jgi:hypothetical protein
MQRKNPWSQWAETTATPTKQFFANLSVKMRTSQFREFEKIIKPTSKDRILDVGVTSDESLKDANLFEKLYKWPKNLTAATIEDKDKIKQHFPKVKVVKIIPGKKLPFKSKSFDVVVSWATLEHVGSRKEQKDFIKEMLRVGNRIFITTPDRFAPYEPHTGFWFLHWLPLNCFRKICNLTNNKFWGDKKNLNPLTKSDLRKMHLGRKVEIKSFKMLRLIPAHIAISTSRSL